MRSTVLLLTPGRRRMMLPLFAALLAFIAAALVTFAASVAKAPDASAQTTTIKSFSVLCDWSHNNYDDPIVYPGKPGAAHGHTFVGNRTTKYNSTYTSLRNATTTQDPDGTTCLHPDDKSAYWIPTVKWNGTDLKPRYAVGYYRNGNKDPASVKPYPAGLKVVPNTHVTWKCDEGSYRKYPPTQCSEGMFSVSIVAPDCSNGQIDSADHRSHMAYSTLNSATGKNECPSTHSTPVPLLDLVVRFYIPTTAGKVTLSSGEASTMHADFFNAWNQQTLEGLVKRCINDPWPSGIEPSGCRIRDDLPR
jgi:hypothetical protein